MWLVIKWWRSLWLVQLTHLGCLKKLDCDTQWNKKCFFVCLRHLCCSSFWRTGIPQITTIPTLSDDGAVRVPFKAISFWNVLNHCNSCVWIRYIIATFCFLSTLRSTEVIPHHRSSGRFGPHCGHHSDGTRCGWVQQQGGTVGCHPCIGAQGITWLSLVVMLCCVRIFFPMISCLIICCLFWA